jgi:hypothetical protein
MKKIILLSFTTIMLCSACKNEPKTEIPAGWQTLKYTLKQPFLQDANYGIELSAPSDWEINNSLKADDLFPSYFLAFPKGMTISPGEVNDGITVMCTSMPSSMTGESMVKQFNDLAGEAVFSLEDRKEITIDGKKCESFIMDAEGVVNKFYFFQNPSNTIWVSFNTNNRKILNEKSATIDSIAERIRLVKM